MLDGRYEKVLRGTCRGGVKGGVKGDVSRRC